MALNAGYALIEFYLSLVAYFILHMIFVIASDFVEAFNIPPLNIGIYVDKLAAIRALLMVIADVVEWRVLDKYFQDFGKASKALTDTEKSPRRIGSIVSFFIMLFCRLHYLWIVYFSDNKSLIAFVNLCIEGFWFGVFQMSFFAIGPEFNAFTSFGIHTMGNFIFMLQVILQREAKKKPKINCLYRVRVHAWIVVVTSIIAICLWIWFCTAYSLGGGDSAEFTELVEELSYIEVKSLDQIADKLATAFKDGAPKFKELVDALKKQLNGTLDATNLHSALNSKKQEIKELLEKEFSVTVENETKQIDVSKDAENTKVTVNVKNTSQEEGNNTRTVTVKGTPGEFSLEVKVHQDLVSGRNTEKAMEVAGKVANRIKKAAEKAKAIGSNAEYNPGKDLLKSKWEFGLKDANVQADTSQKKVTVTAGKSSGETSDTHKVNITGGGDKFNELVDKLAPQVKKQLEQLSKPSPTAGEIAEKLVAALKQVNTQIQALVKEDFKVVVSKVTVDKDESNNVQVKIGEGANQDKGESRVNVTKDGESPQDITIQVKGKQSGGITASEGQAIANALALALVSEKVTNAAEKYTITLPASVTKEVTIQVNNAKSKAQANRIAFKLGKALCQDSVKKRTGALGIYQPQILGKSENVWSPFWLFIIGAFAEDFSVPGILPFAFLDPDKANLVNYLTPSFFMTGALMTVLVNDFFEFKGFASSLGISRFKEWSEGAQPEWNAIWLFNLPKYIAFFIAMFSIHGTYDSLRCIIQSRWRVLILTMTVVVPRAFLETAGYVGVANYAILASETNDFDGFDFIAYHDMLAMFCRFVYGKFAVGYNWRD